MQGELFSKRTTSMKSRFCRWAWRTAAAITLLLLVYLLSIGPVMRLHRTGAAVAEKGSLTRKFYTSRGQE